MRDRNFLAEFLARQQQQPQQPQQAFQQPTQIVDDENRQLISALQSQPSRVQGTVPLPELNTREALARNLLQQANDRNAHPIARGIAAYFSSKELQDIGAEKGRTQEAIAKAEAEKERLQREEDMSLELLKLQGKDRKTLEDAQGFKRYVDTGERVFPNVQAKETSPLVQVNTGEAQETAFQKELGKKQAASVSGFIDAENLKTTQLSKSMQAVNTIESILNQGVATGGFPKLKIAMGEAVRFLGGDPTEFAALKNVNELETIDGMTNKLVIPLAKELGYNPTDADAKRIESSVAGIGKGVEANRVLINFIKNTAARQYEVQQYVDSIIQSNDASRLKTLQTDVNKLRKSFLDEELAKLEQQSIKNKEMNNQAIKESFNIDSMLQNLPEGATFMGFE
jgi:hypothetical protein